MTILFFVLPPTILTFILLLIFLINVNIELHGVPLHPPNFPMCPETAVEIGIETSMKFNSRTLPESL